MGTPAESGHEHRGVIRDDEVVLFICPETGLNAGLASTRGEDGEAHERPNRPLSEPGSAQVERANSATPGLNAATVRVGRMEEEPHGTT